MNGVMIALLAQPAAIFPSLPVVAHGLRCFTPSISWWSTMPTRLSPAGYCQVRLFLESSVLTRMEGSSHKPTNQLHRYFPSQVGGMAGGSTSSPSFPAVETPYVRSPGASPATPTAGATPFFGRASGDQHRQRHSLEPPSGAGDFLVQARGQQHQHHTTPPHNPRSQYFPAGPPANADGTRSPMSVAMSISPPDHHARHLADSPLLGADGMGAYSPDVAGHHQGQQHRHEQQHEQPGSTAGAVGAIVAEVTARRRLRSRSRQQSRDMDIVRRGTPMSDGRQTAAQPRLLWSDLDDDDPQSPVRRQDVNGRQRDEGEPSADGPAESPPGGHP